jgi:hypothetical protein
MDLAVTAQRVYMATPFNPQPERQEVVSALISNLARFESIFSDYQKGCDDQCGECRPCLRAKLIITYMLSKPDTKAWEVWEVDGDTKLPLDLVGILYLTEIHAGCDAIAHYIFFDERLKDKTKLIQEVINWTFTDHPEMSWRALHRLTVQIPTHAFALVRHAQRFLGFGGDFTYKLGNKKVEIEGVKREAIRWRGEDVDVLLLGLLNDRE